MLKGYDRLLEATINHFDVLHMGTTKMFDCLSERPVIVTCIFISSQYLERSFTLFGRVIINVKFSRKESTINSGGEEDACGIRPYLPKKRLFT